MRILPCAMALGAVLAASWVAAPSVAAAGQDGAAASTPTSTNDERARKRANRTLSSADLQKVIAPWVPDILACYKRHALTQKRATGQLTLEMLIHRAGHVQRITAVAPGVTHRLSKKKTPAGKAGKARNAGKAKKTRAARKLQQCIETLARKWLFPGRKGFTTASIPFLFVRTKAKGSGPYESCWSPRGCPDKARKKRAKAPPENTP